MDALGLWIIICAATAVVVCAARELYTTWKVKRTKKSTTATPQLPGGTLGWPLIGETLEFVTCAYSPRPESFMDKRRLAYGKVFKSHIFGSPTIVSIDAEVSRFVLQSGAKSFVPWYPKSLTELMGKSSILMINGSLQRRVHGLIAAFLKSEQLKAQVTQDMQRYVQQAMSSWEDGQLLHIQDEAKHCCTRESTCGQGELNGLGLRLYTLRYPTLLSSGRH